MKLNHVSARTQQLYVLYVVHRSECTTLCYPNIGNLEGNFALCIVFFFL